MLEAQLKASSKFFSLFSSAQGVYLVWLSESVCFFVGEADLFIILPKLISAYENANQSNKKN